MARPFYWLVGPSEQVLKKWHRENQKPNTEYKFITTVAKAEGARMHQDDVIFVERETIDKELLYIVAENILRCDHRLQEVEETSNTEKQELILQIGNTIEHLNTLIKEVTDEARARGISPHRVRGLDGTLMLSPLVAAKAQSLAALAHLKF